MKTGRSKDSFPFFLSPPDSEKNGAELLLVFEREVVLFHLRAHTIERVVHVV